MEEKGGSIGGQAPASEKATTPGMWLVYVLVCADASLYCGVTNDLPRRLARHEAGTGARYTRGRGPFEVVYLEPCADQGEALRREYAIKRLSRVAKLAICARSARKRSR